MHRFLQLWENNLSLGSSWISQLLCNSGFCL